MQENGRNCRNCGAVVRGQYCGDCGQREGRADRRFLDLAGELVGDLFEFDSRFWRTLYPLVLRPGFLSAEFFAGRRARYLPPLRLYLVLSFCLFLALSLMAGGDEAPFVVIDGGGASDRAAVDEVLEGLEDRPAAREAVEEALRESPAAEEEGSAGVHFDLAGEDGPAWLQALEQRLESKADKLEQDPQRMVESMLDYGPQMMFILLPLFALIVQCAYLLSPFHYLQHLVFALHYHAFIYLLYLLEMALDALAPAVAGLLYLWAFAYLPLALRRAYGSGWGGALGKSLAVYFSYGLLMAFATAATAVVALALL